MGRFDGFWEGSLSPWDIAAGVLIVREAGGEVTRYDGGEFTLDEQACSTSGTWGQTTRLGSAVLGHIVDPRSGQPLRRRAQVTVLAPSAAVAEAASTALLVLGHRALDDFARNHGVDACWIDHAGIRTTPGFALHRVV